jgi:hypothetical protein
MRESLVSRVKRVKSVASTLLRIVSPQLIFLSVINYLTMNWNRVNGFCFREIQFTILTTLSKQSQKNDSFHSISEPVAVPIKFDCILIDSTDVPTFFKKLWMSKDPPLTDLLDVL